MLYLYNNQEYFSKVQLLNQVHDSIVFQIPISAGWDYHFDVLMRIKSALESPISYNGIEFSIPIDCEMGLNMKDTVECGLIVSEDLEEAYGRLKDGEKE